MIKELRFVEIINETVSWDRVHWNVSPGSLLKMPVLGTFMDIRVVLTHLEDRFEGIDVEYFLAPDDYGTVNSYNVGEAMDRLAMVDYNKMYESMALTAVKTYDILVTRLHGDTTTVSFYGEYDTSGMQLAEAERDGLLLIEKGYNKDGRPDSKQAVVGKVVNEHGVPLVCEAMDGPTSDIGWNTKAIEYAHQIWGAGFGQGFFVADCKLVTEEHVRRMNDPDRKVLFVSRCPANFAEKLASRMIKKAYRDGGGLTWAQPVPWQVKN